MDDRLNTIRQGDCVAGMNALKAGSVDLIFADPPFNIGYDYDVYQDSVAAEQYLDWSGEWIAAAHRALKPDGTFWLAIGDEYAAELKLASQKIGFHCRSWVIWYYTFGVNCTKKFSRSHAHLFHFVKDPEKFTFRDDDLDNRIPSARQLVYNDKRANPRGRLPDDTWIIRPADAIGELSPDDENWTLPEIESPADDDNTWTLRPQDLADRFKSDEDTWYFPRVAGTFKERAGFHGCQMPEQLLGRIIRACSHENDLVVDPFSGSATTLAVAKKLGRRHLGFELSPEYVKHGLSRLEGIRVGDRLDGAEEPLASAPATGKRGKKDKSAKPRSATEQRYSEVQKQLTELGVSEAYRLTHAGYSADRLIADPQLNDSFLDACRQMGLMGDPRHWNRLLFRLRKSGHLSHIETTRETTLSWADCDAYLFASEIALQMLLDEQRAGSLDEILCDPELAAQFDEIAGRFAPGFSPLQYRWAALKLRKQAKLARSRGSVLDPPRMSKMQSVEDYLATDVPQQPGVYVITGKAKHKLYVGEALNLHTRLTAQFGDADAHANWTSFSKTLTIQTFRTETAPAEMLAWQSCLIDRYNPRLNFHELRTTV